MQIEELMTEMPVCCSPNTSLYKVARAMAEHDCGALPVVRTNDGREIVGVVTDRDIALRAVAKRKPINHISARAIMTETPVAVPASSSARDAQVAMEAGRIRRLPITDEEGACVGIVALADLARALPPEQAGETLARISQPSDGTPEKPPVTAPTPRPTPE